MVPSKPYVGGGGVADKDVRLVDVALRAGEACREGLLGCVMLPLEDEGSVSGDSSVDGNVIETDGIGLLDV